jgi:hypothetical protein
MAAKLAAPVRELAEASLHGWVLAPYLDPTHLIFKAHIDIATPSNNEIKGMHFTVYKKLRERFAHQIQAALGGVCGPAVPACSPLCRQTLCWERAGLGQRHRRAQADAGLPVKALCAQSVRVAHH